MDFDTPESYTIELLTTTVDASGIKATLADGMYAALLFTFFFFGICIFGILKAKEKSSHNRSASDTSEASMSTPELIRNTLVDILIPVLALGSFPILSLYSAIAVSQHYGVVPGYSIATTPQRYSTDPEKQTLTTLLHDEMTAKLAENAKALDKYGLGDRCVTINELTSDNADSILCGGTQLDSVETDKAVFTPDITVNGRGSDPHHVKVTATITTELK